MMAENTFYLDPRQKKDFFIFIFLLAQYIICIFKKSGGGGIGGAQPFLCWGLGSPSVQISPPTHSSLLLAVTKILSLLLKI
jgi:hypothetical protein